MVGIRFDADRAQLLDCPFFLRAVAALLPRVAAFFFFFFVEEVFLRVAIRALPGRKRAIVALSVRVCSLPGRPDNQGSLTRFRGFQPSARCSAITVV